MPKTRSLLMPLLAGAAAGAWLYRPPAGPRRPSPEALATPEVAEAFDWVAGTPQMALLRRYVAGRAAALASDGTAVDLGCGPGRLVVDLARRAPGLHVVGVDLAPQMLMAGRAHAREAGVADRVSWREGDAAAIPLPAGSVDLLVSTLSLHHWADPPAVFAEVARVVRPGGGYYIFDLRRDMPLAGRALIEFATRAVVPAPLREIGEPAGSRAAAYTPAEAAALLRGGPLQGAAVEAGPLWLAVWGWR